MKKINIDLSGLVYKIEDDGSKGYGDSLAETMRLYNLWYYQFVYSLVPSHLDEYDQYIELEESFKKVYKKFFVNNDTLVRAPVGLLPTPEEWGIESHEKDVPGDQTIPMIIALGSFDKQNELEFLLGAQKARGNRYQNGNFAVSTWNVWLRALRQKPTWYSDVNIFTTVMNCCGVVPFWDQGTKTLEMGDPDEVADILNCVQLLMQAKLYGETWLSKKAKAYLKKNCSKSFGSYPVDVVVNKAGEKGLGIEDHILGKIAWYYRKDNPGITDEYALVLKHLMEGV